jgi:hypothetical protein
MAGYLLDGLRAQSERAPSPETVATLLRVASAEMGAQPAMMSSASALLAQIITVAATLALLALWTLRFFIFATS